MTELSETQLDTFVALYPSIETVQRLQRVTKFHQDVFAK